MLWKGRRESTNVDDRRRVSGGKVVAGGGIMALVITLAVMFLGGDPEQVGQLLNQQEGPASTPMSAQEQALDDERAGFVKVVFADTEDVWDKIFAENGAVYEKPTLVLFSGSTQSSCGMASAATGPFYCPADKDIYVDLSFADELHRRFGAKGEFALAYVVAHEVGHHVQHLMGTTTKVARLRSQLPEVEYNKYSVRLELQADFYAGVWAHHNHNMKNVLVKEDIEEALRAAAAVGDDNIQKRTTGTVQPDGFTHGTSEQRMYWFRKGFETGDLRQGDTFEGNL